MAPKPNLLCDDRLATDGIGASGRQRTLNDIFGMWCRRSALCLWGIGRSEPERDEHPTIPGPAECTNAPPMCTNTQLLPTGEVRPAQQFYSLAG